MYNQTLIPAGHPTVVAGNADGPQGLNQEHIARLNWLLRANALAAAYRQQFLNGREEEEMLMMRHPLTTRRACALFGMMLGAFPPAAIFTRLFQYGWAALDRNVGVFIICLLMNITCAGVGLAMGSAVSGALLKLKRASWTRNLLLAPCIGALWGVFTGFAGGLLFFGIGAIFGLICAVPIGMAAFLLFALLHRLLARGGMIDARHFWPLACGIALTITALIL